MGKEEASAPLALLRACINCKDLCRGTRLHEDILRRGLLDQCSDALVKVYAKCGALGKAKEILDMYKSQDVCAWTALIAGYTQKGQYQDALNTLKQMQGAGLPPDAVTYSCILKACGSMRAMDQGEKVHDEIANKGLLGKNIVLGNALVNMYAKCGAFTKALHVLMELPVRNVISWNALLTGFVEHGEVEQALFYFDQMQHEGLIPDAVTHTCILAACGSIKAIEKGEKLHYEITKQGWLENNSTLGNALVHMYVKCGALTKARQVLEKLPVRNVITWTAIIEGYAECGECEHALNCYEVMQHEGLAANAVTFCCLLKACGSIGATDKGEEIHDEIVKQGLLASNIVLGTAVVDMYAKCGSLMKARQVLEELSGRDAISWNSLITGYAEHGEGEEALKCFEQMQSEGLSPEVVTFICVLKACGIMGAVDKGEQIHDQILKQGLSGNDIVLGGALVDMYAKCGALTKSREVLEELPVRNVITWTAIIAGYAEHGDGQEALCCFDRMVHEGLSPNVATFVCLLKACGCIGAADKGEQIHTEIAKQGLLGDDIVLGTALVDMYAKCGALTRATLVLEELRVWDVVSWTALISAYAEHGKSNQALKCFERMQHEGLSPNKTTFSCVLSACSRLGHVEEAFMYFVSMSAQYGIDPDIEHYTCMLDLFGRAGHLDKAVEVIEKMPSCDGAVWSALLGACQKWGDIVVGTWGFKNATHSRKRHAEVYDVLETIYAASGIQKDDGTIEGLKLMY